MSRSTLSPRSPRLLLAATALALTPLLAACGSTEEAASIPTASDSKPTASDKETSAPQVSNEEANDALDKFRDCMTEHGNGPVSPGSDAPVPDQATAAAAFEACQPILDKAGIKPAGGDQGMPAELQKQFLAVAKCMRDKGWDTPDPTFENGQVQMRTEADPAAMKDQEACMAQHGPQMGAQ